MKNLKQKGLIVLFIVALILGITSVIKNPVKIQDAFPNGFSLI